MSSVLLIMAFNLDVGILLVREEEIKGWETVLDPTSGQWFRWGTF